MKFVALVVDVGIAVSTGVIGSCTGNIELFVNDRKEFCVRLPCFYFTRLYVYW